MTVRVRSGDETTMTVDEFVAHTHGLIESKSLDGAGHLVRGAT